MKCRHILTSKFNTPRFSLKRGHREETSQKLRTIVYFKIYLEFQTFANFTGRSNIFILTEIFLYLRGVDVRRVAMKENLIHFTTKSCLSESQDEREIITIPYLPRVRNNEAKIIRFYIWHINLNVYIDCLSPHKQSWGTCGLLLVSPSVVLSPRFSSVHLGGLWDAKLNFCMWLYYVAIIKEGSFSTRMSLYIGLT